MSYVTRGFRGRRRADAPKDRVPPGQYVTTDFPVLSAGPTPQIPVDEWGFSMTGLDGTVHTWTWGEFTSLPAQQVTVDIHCVTKWSKLDTVWEGVSLDVLMSETGTPSGHALVYSYGGYTTNVPVADLTNGKAWVVYSYDGNPLQPEHGGPARLLVPHLYFWKSAKWVRGMVLSESDRPGFWESYGYHNYGDPWQEQRYTGD